MRIAKIILLVLLVVFAALSGASHQTIMTKWDARRFPQEGRSVVLGSVFGRTTLNPNCTGSGNPTVIMDSGLGFPGLEWYLVQPEVAKFTWACSYDRAGYGWSSAGPMPRTSAEIAKELHALLTARTENPPYVLVGHSFGGYNIRCLQPQIQQRCQDWFSWMLPKRMKSNVRQRRFKNRYELVGAPADADLVPQLRFSAPLNSCQTYQPQLTLDILDTKTHFLL